MGRMLAAIVVIALAIVGIYVLGVQQSWYGELEGPGQISGQSLEPAAVVQRTRSQQRAAARLSSAPSKQILFGDLHVHSTYSTDAFLWSLPMMNGEGAHPVADACDYARFCSQMDFWSINDHAEATTPRKWSDTVDSIRQCNAVVGEAGNPDTTAFLGWEWTQVGMTPEDHWGHKNVVLRGLDDDEITTRPIGAAGLATDGLRGRVEGTELPWITPLADFSNRERYFNFQQYQKEIRGVPFCDEQTPSPDLPSDCYEQAATPADLFRKLREWGVDSVVIPHGNTWGFYSPAGTSWDKQLTAGHDDPDQQFLIEVMSGHGNSEEFRDYVAIDFDEAGNPVCPEPTQGYLPSCWRAGQIIEERCLAAGEMAETCEGHAADARRLYLEAGQSGAHVVAGESMEDWLDSGQCQDCFRPSFNHRPKGSTQYALALGGFEEGGEPRRFRFGILASSDNHRARPGTGYKPVDRKLTTEANGMRNEMWHSQVVRDEEPAPTPRDLSEAPLGPGFAMWETERQASFFMTGGLAAVHTEGRDRDAIWEALQRKEVYGTSGERILLWFNLLNAERPDGTIGAVAMGGEASMGESPVFEVRAVGAFEQAPGCSDATSPLGAERLEHLCKGECYNPTDERKRIDRIEIVRIQPQQRPGEPVAQLIQDPWRTFSCDGDPNGCVVRFEDPEFVGDGRETVYYARAIQEPTPVINADPMRCTYDDDGTCIEVAPCYGEEFKLSGDEACADPSEERAWSSPIFVEPARMSSASVTKASGVSAADGIGG